MASSLAPLTEGRITLRDGSKTDDPRLDRLVEFDERSKLFNIADRLESRTLKSRSHPSKFWLSQRREGACVVASLYTEAGGSPKAVKPERLTFEQMRSDYHEVQRRDQWPGGSYPGATPVYEGTSVLAGAKYQTDRGFYDSFYWAFNIDDALLALSHEGPQVYGIPWLDSMYDPRPDGTMDCTGRQVGGHAIQARGVILPRRGTATVTFPRGRTVRIKTGEPLVRYRNTWWDGPGHPGEWGIDGECLVAASDLERLCWGSGWGECMVPIGRKVV